MSLVVPQIKNGGPLANMGKGSSYYHYTLNLLYFSLLFRIFHNFGTKSTII